MRPSRPAPPLWCLLCVAVVVGLALRAVFPPGLVEGPGGGHLPQLQYAWFGFFVTLASFIKTGVEVISKLTLLALRWAVANMAFVITRLGNGLKTLGGLLMRGLKETWDFFKLTYDNVLKPAVTKFWHYFDKFRKWLDDTIGPILKHLREIRDRLLLFWKTYVRPWLDIIDVTRRMLQIFGALGLDWARALDKKLAALEDKIERPFRLLLAKVNEVINIVNRVVTADGLFQRAAYIRTLARDYKFAWQAIANPYRKLPSAAERQRAADAERPKAISAVEKDYRDYLATGGGAAADLYREAAAVWIGVLRSR